MNQSIYEYTVEDLEGNNVKLRDYKGKVLLVVNTASKCGFTPQLSALEKLYQQYKDRGFEILAFPSNDFASQEPLQGASIREFCSLKYGVTFPIFQKIHVRGTDKHPVYRFLSSKKLNGKFNSIPKWNFHKYLLDREGKVFDYFYSITSPLSTSIKRKIEKLLNK